MNIAHNGIRERVGIFHDRAEHYANLRPAVKIPSETQLSIFPLKQDKPETPPVVKVVKPRNVAEALVEAIGKYDKDDRKFRVLVRPFDGDDVTKVVVTREGVSYRCELVHSIEYYLVYAVERLSPEESARERNIDVLTSELFEAYDPIRDARRDARIAYMRSLMSDDDQREARTRAAELQRTWQEQAIKV